ncbi:uncharacterized protein LOC110466781 isoform X2 [Mizuhopecten yessoensis]|uniref:uncharacterized protein LOC110466781 isoform X2 n=1 Tax=Mizuhopecten yessoensis TaxID=6573 RepID=UPI000B45F524|nr:uncharacterized protein LOC110466781 isoform X2 [Mizuhopecten yessoensis]
MSYYAYNYFYPSLGNMSDEYDYEGFESPSTGPEYKIRQVVFRYVFAVFLLLGTIGTFPCIVLLNRYSHTVWSTCVYLSLLLGIDLVKLYVHCGNQWFDAVADENLSWNILVISNSVCKVYTFLISFLNHMSSWIVVAATVELLIAIRFPRHMYVMCTRERSQAVILFIIVLLICLNLHFFWTVGLTLPGQSPEIVIPFCHNNYELSEDFRNIIWPLVEFFVQNAIPMISVFSCLCVCFWHVVQNLGQKRSKDEVESLLGKYFLDLKTLHEMKKATVLLSLYFLMNSSCMVIQAVFIKFPNVDLNFALFDTVLRTMDYAYLSLKPYIFIVFCRKLRQDMVNTFKNCQSKHYQVSARKRASSIEVDRSTNSVNNSAGARPKIYRATGIGTSTGV